MPDLSPVLHSNPSVEVSIDSKSSSGKMAECLINAQTLLQHGEISLARPLVFQALTIDSENLAALRKALLVLNPKREARQRIQIQTAICKIETNFENLSALGQMLYSANRDEESLRIYLHALNLVIDDKAEVFDAYKNIGNILTKSGDFDGAEEYFNKAFTINSHSDVLLVNLGTLSVQRHDFAAALEHFRAALRENERNDKAWVGLALAHQHLGDLALAVANIEKSLDINPENRTAVYLHASWCARDGRYLSAIEFLQNYLATVDLDEDLSTLLIHMFCKTGQLQLAELECERVLLWNPNCKEIETVLNELTNLQGAVA